MSCAATRGAERRSRRPREPARRACASACVEQVGVIRGYRAEIDPAADGRGFEVEVMIELTHKDRATVEEFERRIAVMDPVVACRRMFGVPDYLVRVAKPPIPPPTRPST